MNWLCVPQRPDTRPGAMLAGAVLALAGLSGCNKDEETTWTQYNAEDNTLSIDVGAAEVEDAATVTLTSNTGSVEIGTGTVDPAGGPIGTTHTVTIEVYEDYASDIDRASVRLDSGDRGQDEYTLDEDATGEGYWVIQLESVGDEGETRTDTLTFRLWTEDATSSDSG